VNCLDARRALLVDPRRLAGAESAHLAGCAACRRFGDAVAARERLIDHAARVPVPPGLERRLREARATRVIGGLRALVAAALTTRLRT
jgi:predicted anti-sigma-YlaC factor YlaD